MMAVVRKICRAWFMLLALGLGWHGVAHAGTITFGALSNQIYGVAPFTVSATSSSAGTITFTSSTTAVCTVSGTNGSTVTVIAAGTCTIKASQTGSTAVSQSFTVAKSNQTITFGALSNQTYGAAAFTVSATASSALVVKFTSATASVCTSTGTNGTTITIIAAGTCTIDANQTGNGNYNAAAQVAQSFTVSPASQSITFGTQPNRTDAARPFAMNGTASSGLAVTYTSQTTSTCTVSGSNVSVVADGTCTIAANQAGNGNYTAAAQITQSFTIGPFCVPPPNIPNSVSVTCVCDTFSRANINPSPMFGGTSWAVSASDTTGITPYINSTTGLLRLTENTNYNAKAATAPGIYPAAGNYISVEFNHYAYNGSGADGVAVTLSDSSIPAVPGGYGGSQGYAPESTPGFAGGWLGTALDEYGNYSNPTEGRNGGTTATAEEVGMRGPGSGTSGYDWITGTVSNPGGLSIDNHTATSPAPGYMYQVIVDARTETSGTVNVSVNRDSTTFDGNNYASLIAPYNVYSAAQNAQSQGWISQVVPNYWQISFTSSTGGSTNIHEIGDMRICAQTVYPPSGSQASGFSAIDSAYPAASGSTVPAYQNFQTGDIYMKLQGTAFKLWVAALTSSGISTAYSATTAKYVLLNLVQNTNGAACGTDSARTCTSSCYNQTAVTGGSQILTYGLTTQGALQTANITLNSAYSDLVAVMKECTSAACTSFTSTAPACSADSFSVRPTGVTTVVSNATNATASGTPVFPAGNGTTGGFTMTATTAGVSGQPSGYNGLLRVNNSAVRGVIDTTESPSWVPLAGVIAAQPANQNITFPAATSGTGSATSVGTFTYGEVGGFMLPGYSPTDTTNYKTIRSVYDGVTSATDCPSASVTAAQCDALRMTTWSGVDSVSTKNDCNIDSYSNTIDSTGKYGCNFGNIANSATMGRFSPDHYVVVVAPSSPAPAITPRSDMSSSCETTLKTKDANFLPFSYMGEPFGIAFTLNAVNAGNVITTNYQGNYVKFNSMNTIAPWIATTPGSTGTMGLAMTATNATQPGYTNSSKLCSVYFSAAGVTSYSCPGVTVLPVANGGTPRVTATSTPSLPTMNWSSGAGAGGIGTFTANVTLQRLTAGPDGPFNNLGVGILPTDTDNVTSTVLSLATNNGATAPALDRVSLGTTAVKFGELQLQNNFGSAAASLPISAQMLYWNGAGFVVNSRSTGVVPNYSYDSCTTINGGNVNMSFTGNIAACNTYMPATTTLNNGIATLTLAAPGQSGSVNLTDYLSSASTGTACSGSTTKSTATSLNAPFLQGNWNGSSTYTVNPSALATFGVYSGVKNVIYIRESY